MSRRHRKHTHRTRPPRPERQANGEPESREIEKRWHERRAADQRVCPIVLPESAMGGTSDAGTAADEAAEAANFGIGTDHDLTKGEV